MSEKSYLDYLSSIAQSDVDGLKKAHESYGDSCLRRGGVGLFMMFARKWDRLENQVKKLAYDIFEASSQDTREEGILDDIRDLRRYLLICEAEIMRRRSQDSLNVVFTHQSNEVCSPVSGTVLRTR
jgi:hypothetical protein